MIARYIEKYIEEYLTSESYKIFFLWGPRRAGKTTLLKNLSEKLKVPYFNFDLISDQEKFTPDKNALSDIAAGNRVILIDEIQNYPGSTKALKILHDELHIKVIATGSSELRQKTNEFESLSGRYFEYRCLPLSLEELHAHHLIMAYEKKEFAKNILQKIPILGSYPEIYISHIPDTQKIDLLKNIAETYMIKDIVTFYGLKNIKLARDILIKIALQIGHEVSLNELANSLGANVATVSHYIEIFIKNYILIPLPSFKTNVRRAVSSHRKLFFLDLGLRNALVEDFRPLELRPDKGGVFENFIVSEIFKKISNSRLHINMYFYREYSGKEVDLVLEDYQKKYRCLEIKYAVLAKESVFPLPHDFSSLHAGNYFDVIQSV